MSNQCGVLFRGYNAGDPHDPDGCIMPDGHLGPHVFIDLQGKEIEWFYDYECPCGCNDDFDGPGEQETCIIYGTKNTNKP